MSGLTKRVREIISREPKGSLGAIYAVLEDENFQILNKVFNRLERRGELEIRGKRYRYTPRSPRSGKTQRKIWAAMRNLAKVNRQLSLEDVVLLSGASLDYVRRYTAYLIREKHLARRQIDGVIIMLALNQIQAPHWNRRKAESGKGANHG